MWQSFTAIGRKTAEGKLAKEIKKKKERNITSIL